MPMADAIVHAWSTRAGQLSADLQLAVSRWTFKQLAGMTASYKDITSAAAEATSRRKPRGVRRASGQQTLAGGSNSASVSDNPWGDLADGSETASGENPWGNLDDGSEMAPAAGAASGENPWGDLADSESQDPQDSQNPWGDLGEL